MTHSHDTATPALSVESEEAVAAALWQEEAREGTPKSIWQARTLEAFRDTADSNQERWRRFARAALDAAPAPNPSPAAKDGEAVVERFECEHDEDTYTVTWPDGRWLIVSEDGTLTHGKSPRSEDFPAVRTSLAALATPSPQPAHPDDRAVDRFAVAMKAKLADARAKGKGGWNDEIECSRQYLSDELRRHALKPDPLDVANFAMFLHQRNEEIALPPPQPADAVREAVEDAIRRNMAMIGGRVPVQFGSRLVDDVRAALASDPAPTGEAVEPVARLDGVDEYGPRLGWFKQWTKVPVGTLFYVHPAPEDTARLREELERVTRVNASMAEEIVSIGLARDAAECERDDARKVLGAAAQALETAAGRFNMMGGVGIVNGVNPKVGYAEACEASRSARSASREGAA